MKRLLTAPVLLVLFGCESHDRIMATDFVPRGPGVFTFRAPAALQYPLDTAEGEASRIRMLDEWMATNSYCPRGYEIISRTPIQRTALVHDVHYEGRCK